MRTLLGVILLLVVLPDLNAREVAGVAIKEQVYLAGSEQVLKLNGAGIRKKLFFSIYVAALYLQERSSDAEKIVAQNSPRRVYMHMLYSEVTKEQFIKGWNDGFLANQDEAAMVSLRDRLDRFNGFFETLQEGDEILLDYLPGEGTRVVIRDELKGTIPGADFNQALLEVWLGQHPVTKSLRSDLLGNP